MPEDILRNIFIYLKATDLCNLDLVCRDWRHLGAPAVRNEMWWRLTMKEQWHDGSVPQIMSRQERKKDWRLEYMQITASVRAARAQWYQRRRQKPKKPEFDEAEEAEGSTSTPSNNRNEYKDEMRSYYKSIRSKPKNKRAKGKARTHSALWDECVPCDEP